MFSYCVEFSSIIVVDDYWLTPWWIYLFFTIIDCWPEDLDPENYSILKIIQKCISGSVHRLLLIKLVHLWRKPTSRSWISFRLNLKQNEMEPHERMHHLFHNLLRKLCIFIAHDIFREGEFKPYARTYFMYGLLGWFFASVFKTIAYYDMTVVLQMIPFLGVAIEVILDILVQ